VQISEEIKMLAKERFPKSVLNFLRRAADFLNGFWPVIPSFLVMSIRSRNPVTYQQKMIYKIAYDRNPIITTFADKYQVREYIANKIGDDHLSKLYGIFSSAEEITQNRFPRNFALKATHGSGGVVLVSENADPTISLPTNLSGVNWERYLIHPDSLDWKSLLKLANHWLKLNFWNSYGHYPEWAYKRLVPRIMAEELLVNDGQIPQDYRFFVFEGRCEFIEVDSRWHGNSSKTLFDRNWEFVNATRHFPGKKASPISQPLPIVPHQFERMRDIAENLAEETDHLRVDLYSLPDRVIVGELTNYHTSGIQRFRPESFNEVFGLNWDPQKYYSRRNIFLT
jgi:TupA-like ATPgrasp